jgi:hypothetical protein
MLHYAVESPLRVHGDNFGDGPENRSTIRIVSHRSSLGHFGPRSASYRFRFSEDF